MQEVLVIVEQCKQNNPEAQHQLYKMLASKLMGICMRYTKSRDLAEDYLQDSFIKIFTNISKFENKGSFEGWAKRVTINTILKGFSKRNVLDKSDDIDEMIEQPFERGADIISGMAYKELLTFLQYLQEGKRVIFNLYVMEGYTHKEIAEQLDINEGTSKSQLAKAKEILRDLHIKHNRVYATETT